MTKWSVVDMKPTRLGQQGPSHAGWTEPGWISGNPTKAERNMSRRSLMDMKPISPGLQGPQPRQDKKLALADVVPGSK